MACVTPLPSDSKAVKRRRAWDRMISVPIFARSWTGPVQRPGRARIVVTEQVGADRFRQRGIIEQYRKIFAGLLAGACPCRPNLRTIGITVMNAIGWRVFGIRMFRRSNGKFPGEREGVNAPGKARFIARELSDLWHDKSPVVDV